MRILHTGDIHLGDLAGPVRDGRNARREDTLRCMRAIAEAAKVEQPNVSIIAGDLFNRSRVWADTALDDIDAAVSTLIRPLCRESEKVVLLFGTMNHDNPKAFNVLRNLTQGIHNLTIYTTPEVDRLNTSAGEIQILAMPGFDKGRLRAFMPDADAETENQNATTLVNEIIAGQAAQLDPGKPSVLVAHYTVAGCESESGQTFLAGQDVVILPQTIDATGVTLACFGHIHKAQALGCNTPAYYCGSPNQLTFNDEGCRHGFWIHEISEAGEVTSRFTNTPERRHLTLRLLPEQVIGFIAEGKLEGVPPEAKDAIVRVYYDATQEQDKALNRAALQNHLMQDHGAFYVAEFIREDLEDALVTEGVATEDTPAAALHRYLDKMREDSDGLMNGDDTARLEELAAPIIREADDGREADRHTGAFIPKRIEVTNYRSYTHAEFDFADIRMAMVNGQNGVGKSSLFMDAIADCLYETSRDGAIGEWLRDGEKKGAVTFEFEMGGYDYRVARTRTKSGKGTLALARRNPDTGEWENDGDTTMKLTQAKITRIVGMDCQTFCSIALIRQDAYGLFLEADSDRRMEVLSSLLNLGVYSRAEEIAKARATDQRRKLASLNDRMSVLDEQMAAREGIQAQMKECEADRTLRAAQTKALDGQIQAAEREEALRQELIRQAGEKAQEAARMAAQAGEKDAELSKQKTERNSAAALAGMAEAATAAAETIAKARADLEPLAEDEARLKSLTDRQTTLLVSAQRLRDEIARLQTAKAAQASILDRKAEIEAAVQEMEAIRTERQALTPRLAAQADWTRFIAEKKANIQTFLGDSRVRIGRLNSDLKSAQQKAQLLTDSGCPMPDTASCAFLKDAQAAKARLADLEKELEAVKAKDRKAYETMLAEVAEAEKKLSELGDPNAELDALVARERKATPAATQAAALEAATATIAQLDRQEAEKTAALEEAEKELKDIAEQLPPLQEWAKIAEKLRLTIKDNEATAALQAQCAAAVATVKALDVTIDLITRDAEKARQEAAVAAQTAAEMQARIPAPGAVSLDALRSNRDALAQDAEELAKRLGGLQAKLDGIEQAKVQWEAYRDEKTETAKRLTDYQTLAGAFGIDGIQYVIIRSIVPEIQARANAILSAMTGGRMAVDFRTEREVKTTQKIVNSLDVWITSINGGCRPYSSHSGGEKVKIALAVTLGLADVKAHRAGVQLGMLWIDEPPFLDGDGTEAYADALVSMANRNPEMRILAISHDPQLKARFAQNITVTAGENGSEVSMA